MDEKIAGRQTIDQGNNHSEKYLSHSTITKAKSDLICHEQYYSMPKVCGWSSVQVF